jgi:hypothetical protein
MPIVSIVVILVPIISVPHFHLRILAKLDGSIDLHQSPPIQT